LPLITGNVTILGAGDNSIIERNICTSDFRLFDVDSSGTLKLRKLTVANGQISDLGGAIRNAGTLILKNVFLRYKNAFNGGAVTNLDGTTTTVYDSFFLANSTTSVGGGGIINYGTLNIFDSSFVSNQAPINGGGINTQSSGVTTITESAFFNNTSGGLGGALSNIGILNIR